MKNNNPKTNDLQNETLTSRVKKCMSFIITPIIRFLDKLGIGPNALTIIGFLGSIPTAYLIARGFTAEPVAPVIGRGGATKKNS